jgi:hypothetical protein
MPFANANNCSTVGRDTAICVPQTRRRRRFGRNRPRRTRPFLAIKTLIFEVGKEEYVVVDEVAAATIFVRSCPHIEACRDGIGWSPRNWTAHDDHASAFIRPALEPIQITV